MVAQALRRLYAPEFLIKPSLVRGNLPNTKEAYRTTFSTAWASIAESFLIALISMADTVMVSAVGAHAIAAVGLVTQPRFIVLTATLALGGAVTSVTARRKGENDPVGAIRCLKQAIVLTVILSTVISSIAFAGNRPLLLFAGAQSDTLEMAQDYFRIILIGTPICSLSMTISAAQRGIGQTRVSMLINMTANCVNLVLNYLLIGGRYGFPALGVRGAAIATVIGWTVGLVLAVLSVAHRDRFLYIFSRKNWDFDRQTLGSLYKVASGSFVELICLRIGFLAYAKIVAGLGTILFAGHQIFINILSLSFSFGEGFGIAASSLVGQNLGARRPDLSQLYGKTCQRLSYIVSFVVFFVFIFGGKHLILLFSDEPEILQAGSVIMIIMGLIVFGQSSQMIMFGALRGAGDTKYTAVVSLICVMLLRPILAYIMAYSLGWSLTGAWVALAIDQHLRLVFTSRRFSSGKWMEIKL